MDLRQRVAAWIQAETLLLAVLAGSFLARLLIATRNSYWLDEIYQVTIHGAWNETVTDLVRVLANNTVYPPLYFVALYEWMGWFGDSELATRLLSNIYVTLAGLFLYLAIRIGFSRRIALLSVVTYTLLYTVTIYGLEARPYAQTILLVTVSSYLWLRLLRAVKDRGWRLALVSPAGSVFTVVNVAVLLTHYYNLFFWLAQLILSAAFVLTDRAARQWIKGIGIVTLVYGLQAAIFVGVWGRNTVAAVDRQAAGNTIESAAELRSPFGLALDSIILPNIRPPLLLMWIGGALIVIAVLRSIGRVLRRNGPRVEHLQAWVTLYLANWLMMPLVMAFVGFLVAGVARYSSRYFVFSVVPLAPLVILGVEEGVRSTSSILRRRRPYPVTHENEGRRWQTWAVVVSLLLICTLILPRTYAAAVAPKGDWRGTSQTIVDIIESNPEASYAVYETSFRRIPMLDYYLARFSDDIRVSGTIQRVEERRESFAFEKDTARIGEYDYLIVPFIHHTIYDFPKAVERLKQLYEVHYWQIGPDGTGLAIFAV